MSKRIAVVAIVLSFFLINTSFGQQKGTVSGFIKDSHTGTPLICANITIKGTFLGAASDIRGIYFIKNVPEGTHTVTVSILGYATESKDGIIVTGGQTTKVDFELKNQPIEMGKVTVTATRGNYLVTEVPVSTAIITNADFERTAAQTVGEVLESAGGVFIKDYGDIASMKTISMRGSTDNQVLVLIDGQRLNNAQNASVDFNNIPLDKVEKIEIVKGGNSALYGANAVGGVVNIISKSAIHGRPFAGNINTSFGSQGIQIYSVGASQDIGKIGYILSFKHLASDGDYEYEDATGVEQRLQNNDIKSNNVFLKVHHYLGNNAKLAFSTQYSKIEKGLYGSITYPTPKRRMDETISLNNLSFDGNFSPRLHLRANAYYHHTNDEIDDPENWDPSALFSRHKNNALGLELQNRFIVNKNILFTYGYDFRVDKLESTQIGDKDRNTHGLYLQGEFQKTISNSSLLDKVVLIPAVRYDDYSDIGSQTSPKFGIAVTRSGNILTTLRSNVGKSFRSPTFNDLYWPEDFWSVGNPDLKPETGFNYDAGLLLQYDQPDFSANFELTYFASNLEDLIIWAPIDAVKWSPQNVDKSETDGIETILRFDFFEQLLSLDFAHTYMSAINKSKNPGENGKDLIYRPKNKFDIGLGVNYKFMQLQLGYRFVDKTYTDSYNTSSLPSHEVYDLSVGVVPMISGLKLLAKLDVMNLTDENYNVMFDYPMPGRQVRFTVGLQY